MNKNRLLKIRHIGCTLLAALFMASCSQDESLTGGTPLPDGEYPLMFTASVDGMNTRAAGKDGWTDGDEIGVRIGTGDAAGRYKLTADGAVKETVTPVYWQNTAPATVTAWHPYETTGADGQPVDVVDITDQSGGYAAFDFLRAETQGQYGQPASLAFHHQMAKVKFTLIKHESIAEDEFGKAAVTILGDAATTFKDGVLAVADQNDGEIKPSYDSQTKNGEAVVVPQRMDGKKFIRVSIGDDHYYYTPKDGEANLEAGKVYTYNITVKKDRIEVEVVTGGTWNDSNRSENIESKEVKQSFTESELKIGDYFYSDGSWSDGGLRTIYADGSIRIANPKPVPELSNAQTGGTRQVVGIVFQTDPSRIGEAEKKKLGKDNVHGLVMSVKNASTSQKWGPFGTDEGLTKCNTKADNYNDISGYGNCEHIRANRGNFDNHPAFKAADDYNTTCPVPATTTGWYLPASGQWWDILQNLGGCTVLADEVQQTSSDDGDFNWTGQGNVPAALNAWMAHIAAENKNTFGSSDWFWSSSEYSDGYARYWHVYSGGNVGCYWYRKRNRLGVRPVLAF